MRIKGFYCLVMMIMAVPLTGCIKNDNEITVTGPSSPGDTISHGVPVDSTFVIGSRNISLLSPRAGCVGSPAYQIPFATSPAGLRVIWSSLDTTIAKVDTTGAVLSIAPGVTKIKGALALDSVVTDSALVTVTACMPPVGGITMTFLPNPLVFHIGTGCAVPQIYQANPHVFPAGTSQKVTFTTPVTDSVITVGSTGIVTPIKIGSTTLTAVDSVDTTVTATITVTVDSLVCINAPGGTSMRVGSVQQLTTNPGNIPGSWVSSRASVLAVNSQSGITTAVSASSNADVCFYQTLSATNAVKYGCLTIATTP